MKHSEVTRRGRGQGADPECPPGQKQWVTPGPKYRLCGCHSGKPAPDAAWRVGPVGRAQKAAPLPSARNKFIHILASRSSSTCLFCGFMSPSFPFRVLLGGSLPLLSLVPCRPRAAAATSSRCSHQSAPHGALAGSQEFGVQVLGVGFTLGSADRPWVPGSPVGTWLLGAWILEGGSWGSDSPCHLTSGSSLPCWASHYLPCKMEMTLVSTSDSRRSL